VEYVESMWQWIPFNSGFSTSKTMAEVHS